jgi:hypothetical protein
MHNKRRTAIAATAASVRLEEGRSTRVKRALLLPLFALLWLCSGLFEVVAYLLVGRGDPESVDDYRAT